MWRSVIDFHLIVTALMWKNLSVSTCLSTMATTTTTAKCFRLGSLTGDADKVNEVILCLDATTKPDSHVIFFGGDVQDYKENMESYLPHKKYVKWNLEDTAKIIHSKFPTSLIWVIRPKLLLNNTFSVYSNFLASIMNGAPNQTVPFEKQGSWFHLSATFSSSLAAGHEVLRKGIVSDGNSCSAIEDTGKETIAGSENVDVATKSSAIEDTDKDTIAGLENEDVATKHDYDNCDKIPGLSTSHVGKTEDCDKTVINMGDNMKYFSQESLSTLPVHIIGFSKGCVVLNQLLFDLEQVLSSGEEEGSGESLALVHKVRSMVWLDGGHAGGNNTWVTKRQVLSHLKQLQDFTVTVHVTPYQVKDELRVWIGREQRQFTRNLRSLGVPVEETLHFKEEEASLDNHFRVLTVF